MMDIKKAIIPSAGLGTRFLPLTKVVSKELLPLVEKPLIHYAVQEAKASGIFKIIFVLSENKKNILNYFKKDLKLQNLLKERNQKELLEKLEEFYTEYQDLTFSGVVQLLPKGDGDAVLKARRQIGKENFAVLFPDDVWESRIPPTLQLKKIFLTSQKPVIGLKKIEKEKVSSYGVVMAERIATRIYKIKDIVEKPSIEEAPSDLVIAGRYTFSPDIFNYLTKTPPNKKGELILAEALKLMINDGKIIYGYELEGEWLECGNIQDWLKSNFYLCLKNPEYGPMLREWLKKLK